MFALLFFVSAVLAQDIPIYKMTRIVVTPGEEFFGPKPDAVIEIPENSPGRAPTLDEALKGAPGVAIARNGGPGQPAALFFRGAPAEHTLVLVDGVEVNDASAPAGAFDFSTLDMNMVERIEIFKGPQAMRFGSGAMGGVINVITRKGRGPMKTSVSARAGSLETNQFNASLSGGSGENSHYALSVTRFESSGISAAKNGGEKDGHRYWAGALRLGTELGGTEIDFVSRASFTYTELDYAQSSVGPFFLSPDDPNYHVTGSHSTHALSAHRSWSERARTRATVGYDYVDRLFRNSPDAVNAEDSRTYRWAGTLKADAPTEIALNEMDKLSFGPAYRREEAGRDSELLGAFVELARAKEGFFGGVGARADHHSRFGEQFSYQVAPGFRAAGFAVVARLATAFKAPSLFQLFDPSFGNRDLTTEQVEGKEVSVQKTLGSALLTLTGFRYDYRNLIQFSSRYENLGRARVQGAELEFNSGGETEFEAAYTYTDARNRATDIQLIRRPFHTWRAGVARDFGEHLSARAMYHGVGRRRDIDALTSAASENGAYDTLDVSLAYQPKLGLQFTLSVENSLDKDYEPVDGYGAPGVAVYGGVQAAL